MCYHILGYFALPIASRRFFVKKSLLSFLALLIFLAYGLVGQSSIAEAKSHSHVGKSAVEVELLGKLGGMSNFIEKESFGDTQFDIAGGLMFNALFRFDMGVGVGLNFNWEMSRQRLELSKLTYALQARDRVATVQMPSCGFTLHYAPNRYFDSGFWINYGFGSYEAEMNVTNSVAASAFELTGANLKWDMQAVEIGILGEFTWDLPVDGLALVIGGQIYANFARLFADDSTLDNARDLHGRRVDENRIDSIGFNVVFGMRYSYWFNN